MSWRRPLKMFGMLALVALSSVALASSASAGCGCDHPPPDWTLVMPPFGSPGKAITINADSFEFVPGQSYGVKIGGKWVVALAEATGSIVVPVQPNALVGPSEVQIVGGVLDVVYPASVFTVMPVPRALPAVDGIYLARHYEIPVTADGTLLIPLDVGEVLDPTQFAFALPALELAFGHEDVVIYNADGVDLTLFTLDVEDPTLREWGEYYGWQVSEDGGLGGMVYEPAIGSPVGLLKEENMSDIFSYWRHEFYTYADAHAPGGSHQLGAGKLHPDGTRHVDHNQLVIAIRGHERSTGKPLDPGKLKAHVAWLSLVTPDPIALSDILGEFQYGLGAWIQEMPSSETDYDAEGW